jgi:hypothetical protein
MGEEKQKIYLWRIFFLYRGAEQIVVIRDAPVDPLPASA